MIFSGTHVLYKSTCGCNDIRSPAASHTLQTHAYVHICAFMHTHGAESVNILATCAQYIYANVSLLSFIYKAPYTLRIKAVRPGMYHTNSWNSILKRCTENNT